MTCIFRNYSPSTHLQCFSGLTGISHCLQSVAAQPWLPAYNLLLCGRRSMAGPELPKIKTWVRSPSPAPISSFLFFFPHGSARGAAPCSSRDGQKICSAVPPGQPPKTGHFPKHVRCPPSAKWATQAQHHPCSRDAVRPAATPDF